MIELDGKKVYLACGHTDMRKSINGLVAIVECSFKLDPLAGSLFAFCNKARNRIKILEWDGDGFWLYFKRLEKGRFKWTVSGDEKTMILSDDEFKCLISSAKLEKKLRRSEVFERLIS